MQRQLFIIERFYKGTDETDLLNTKYIMWEDRDWIDNDAKDKTCYYVSKEIAFERFEYIKSDITLNTRKIVLKKVIETYDFVGNYIDSYEEVLLEE